jgi:hypothetical protein
VPLLDIQDLEATHPTAAHQLVLTLSRIIPYAISHRGVPPLTSSYFFSGFGRGFLQSIGIDRGL